MPRHISDGGTLHVALCGPTWAFTQWWWPFLDGLAGRTTRSRWVLSGCRSALSAHGGSCEGYFGFCEMFLSFLRKGALQTCKILLPLYKPKELIK